MRHGSCTPTLRTTQERLQGLPAMRSSPTAAHRACATSATRRRLPITCSIGGPAVRLKVTLSLDSDNDVGLCQLGNH